MAREDFLKLLAQFIVAEAEANPKSMDLNEPFRAAGDSLVDAALEYID